MSEHQARVLRLPARQANGDGTYWALLQICLLALLLLGIVHEIQQLTDRIDELDTRLHALEAARGKP